MPTFMPPVTEGIQRFEDHSSQQTTSLFRFYEGNPDGNAVWKDEDGVWQQSPFPYLGGETIRVFNNGQLISEEGPIRGIATAQVVFLGGMTHPISEDMAQELMDAGFNVTGHIPSEEQWWIDYAIASQINKAWKGGDACASLYNPGNGFTVWSFADNLIGTVNPNGMYGLVLPVNNACVVQDANGDFFSQIYNGANPPWLSNPTPGHWWWPMDLNFNGPDHNSPTVVCAWDVSFTGVLGVQQGTSAMIQLTPFSTFSNYVEFPTPTDNFYPTSIYNDVEGGYHYIIGVRQEISVPRIFDAATYSRIARVAIGGLMVPANYEYWNGREWVQDQAQATDILDQGGNPLQGWVDITKVGDKWVMAWIIGNSPTVSMFHSDNPQGPWIGYHQQVSLNDPPAGRVFNGGGKYQYAYYQIKFHEQLSPNDRHLVVTYNRNILPHGSSVGNDLTKVHCATFCPQFLYCPVPE